MEIFGKTAILANLENLQEIIKFFLATLQALSPA